MKASKKKKNLLIVDDEPMILKLMETVFGHARYKVTSCTNGRDGLLILNRQAFDCIITDVVMPGMDGFELAQAIRNDSKHCRLPILMLTRYRSEPIIRLAAESGVTDYILKPIDEELLIAKVERAIRSSRAHKIRRAA